MIKDEECTNCDGHGKVHSPGRNGDPMDLGEDCPVCDGAGCVEVDLDDLADD